MKMEEYEKLEEFMQMHETTYRAKCDKSNIANTPKQDKLKGITPRSDLNNSEGACRAITPLHP